ncbi:fimbria/pilus periplasmic chaperone [Pseudomonas gingeri]|uniref:fimbria/pilus periplasmic chaperone n=1 Tax=Pseudomonas gingeri TaxID=117681 RepID=UPI0015A08C7C|nr:fimbria/pilus periplasmic chaperone [Pseudomonas gingeri]NWE24406.1 fimbria/pilus periplasmic chaperone [Pseudomonas gingeri]NWE97855.1 fimbria/pilus periplasmic chaperone [Pseudomonas gingeri]
MNTLQRSGTTARLVILLFLAALILSTSFMTQASVIITGTRVVYPANQKEVTIRFENKNQKPALVQVWLDTGNEEVAPEQARVPFLATPPIFRIEPGKQQVVRLAYTGEPLPTDKESLFWLNMLEVPPKAQDSAESNQLQLAFRTRIKVFFRPKDLPYESAQAAEKLRWTLVNSEQGQSLQVHNPTPYHLNFDSVELVAAGQRHAKPVGQTGPENMVDPKADNRFPLPSLKSMPKAGAWVEFQTIDDYGARHSHKAQVTP